MDGEGAGKQERRLTRRGSGSGPLGKNRKMWEDVDIRTVAFCSPPSLNGSAAGPLGMDREFPLGSAEASLTCGRDAGQLAAGREGRWRGAGTQSSSRGGPRPGSPLRHRAEGRDVSPG